MEKKRRSIGKPMICIAIFFLACSCIKDTIRTEVPREDCARSTASLQQATLDMPLVGQQDIVHSTPKFQVFILTPVRFCMAGNEYKSGQVCRGEKCGDCNCAWEDFDPPAPMTGIPPSQINDPRYDQYLYKDCVEVTLSQAEINAIIESMEVTRRMAYEWTGGALDLQMEYHVLSHDHVGFTAPDFVFGPFEVDDELLNPYVGRDTAFVYVVSGIKDRLSGLDLAPMCGGSYGEMSIHGAGFASIQYNTMCNSVRIDDEMVYEPLIHEWYHNLDWALFHIHHVPDALQDFGPDWANWNRASMPACGDGPVNPLDWFPSIDFCEWDPDWMDCSNQVSRGCAHAGEKDGEPSWYEHVLSVHYPRGLEYTGNFCSDGVQDFGETGMDTGGACP